MGISFIMSIVLHSLPFVKCFSLFFSTFSFASKFSRANEKNCELSRKSPHKNGEKGGERMDLSALGYLPYEGGRLTALSFRAEDGFPVGRLLLPPNEGLPEPVAELLAAAEKGLREKGSAAALSAWEKAQTVGTSKAAYRPVEYRLTIHQKPSGDYVNWLLAFQARRGSELLSFWPLTLLTVPGFSAPLPLSFFLGGKRARETLWTLSDKKIYPLVCRFAGSVRLPAASAPLRLMECGEAAPLRRLPIPPKNRKRKKKALDKPGKDVYNMSN